MNLKEISFIEFDEFAKNHPLKSFYQSSNYALIMGEKNFDYEYIGLFNEMNVLVAASLILTKKIKKNISYGYAPKGFLIDYKDKELIRKFTNLLKEYYSQKNVAFIKINPDIIVGKLKNNSFEHNFQTEEIKYTLSSNSYIKLKNNLYFESSLPRFNAIVDLNKLELRNLRKNTRNKIYKSQRKGLLLEKGNINSINVLERIIRKNKNYCNINLNDYYNVFNRNDSIDIFLVKIDYEEFLINARISYDKEIEKNTYYNSKIIDNPTEDNINAKMNSDLVLLAYKNDILEGTKGLKDEKDVYIAGAMVVKYGNTATIVASAFDKTYSRHNANYFLHYKIMEYYKNELNYIDLNGMTGDLSTINPYYGLNQFKLGFNPNVFEYIGEYDLIINENDYSYLKETGILAKEFNKKND